MTQKNKIKTFDDEMAAYKMCALGAVGPVIAAYFPLNPSMRRYRTSLTSSTFRGGLTFLNQNNKNRMHSTLMYHHYLCSYPHNAQLKRLPSANELIAMTTFYNMVFQKNRVLDINRLYSLFAELRKGNFLVKPCSKCSMNFVLHYERNHEICPFCFAQSSLTTDPKAKR